MAEAGWYKDKHDPTILRKWDGVRWTGETADFSAPPPPTPVVPAVEPIDWVTEVPAPPPWWRSPWTAAAGALALVTVAVAVTAGGGGGGSSDTTTTLAPADTRPREAATTLPPVRTPQQARDAFAGVFENSRTPIASILGDDRNVRSLQALAYDPTTGVVTLQVTSAWTATVDQANGDWELTRVVAELYKRGRGQWWQEAFVPGFRLLRSGSSRTCAGELMVQFSAEEQGRPAWEATCPALPA